MIQKTKSGLKIISNNRKARFNYFFTEFFEAGIALKGSEVKSLRDGKANISESYAFDEKGERISENIIATPSKKACKWCEFRKKEYCSVGV